MTAITQAILNTPPWVWLLFAFLMFLGIRALKPSTTSLPRLAILPAVFFVWGVSGVVAAYGIRPLSIIAWLAAFVIGVGCGTLLARATTLEADRTNGLVRIAGGPSDAHPHPRDLRGQVCLRLPARDAASVVRGGTLVDVGDCPVGRSLRHVHGPSCRTLASLSFGPAGGFDGYLSHERSAQA